MSFENIILNGTKEDLMERIPLLLDFLQILEQKDVGTIYAYTNDKESVRRVGKPKVILYFLEDSNYNKKTPKDNVYEGKRRLEGAIRFRLMDETTQSFSKANATALGNRVKQIFGSNDGFIWKKGKTMYSYNDWERGYQFQLLCRSEEEAKRIITAVTSLQNHPIDWKYFDTVKNDQEAVKYPENPGTHLVMGEVEQLPRERPLVDVRFQYAYVKLDGVKEPINLYARNKRRAKTLVS